MILLTCDYCSSDKLRNKGAISRGGVIYARYKCKSCGLNQYKLPDGTSDRPQEAVDADKVKAVKMITPAREFETDFKGKAGIVITSCINDTPINLEYFESLVKYTEEKNYQLFVIPIKYMNPSAMNMNSTVSYPPIIHPYLLQTTVKFGDQFKIIGDCNIQATATHPLTGIDGLCEGMTTIVGHPILQFKTLAVNHWRDPIILSSTGCISNNNRYSASKAGYRASFHHTFSAVVIELDNGFYHLRHLMADDNGGFADLDEYWSKDGMTPTEVDAIVFGDEHVIFADEEVYQASFFSENSLVHKLRPKYLIRHDVFDAISCGKHDVNNFFNRYKKHNNGSLANVETEIIETLRHLEVSTPEWATTMIVGSNHDDHLDQWLNQYGEPKNDYINAELYYHMMYRKLKEYKSGLDVRKAFQIYAEDIYKVDDNIRFMYDGFAIHDIQLSSHGHQGPNGSRGSASNLSKIGEKNVIGHSHSPHIIGNTYQVGLSGTKAMDYAKGSPSSWLHTHCVIHKNGTRQLVNIVKGKWCTKYMKVIAFG